MRRSTLLVSISILFLVSGCFIQKRRPRMPQPEDTLPCTVFVHGTLPPLINQLVAYIDCPLGLTHSSKLAMPLVLSAIPYYLDEGGPDEFPLENSYIFGWPGELSFKERKKASYALYEELKKLPHPLTVIGMSHGCNVILNLAAVAREKNDTSFKIDRVILLAGPVQSVTEQYIEDPIFEKIYSFYSTKDVIQLVDPQGIYDESKQHSNTVPLFSGRTLKPHQKVTNVRLLLNRRSPGHTEFNDPPCMRSLASIIRLIDSVQTEGSSENHDLIINIARDGKPELLEAIKRHKKVYLVKKEINNLS